MILDTDYIFWMAIFIGIIAIFYCHRISYAQGWDHGKNVEISMGRGYEQTRLIAERDEADRRAGAAERQLEFLEQQEKARDLWLTNAKKEWGVTQNISFDKVWEEALELKNNSKQITKTESKL